MTKLAYTLCRAIALHAGALIWIAATCFVAWGLVGPKYSSLLAQVVLFICKAGLAVGILTWVAIVQIRKRNSEFRWSQVVSDYSDWQKSAPLHRVGWTAFCLGVGCVFSCLGALAGTKVVLVFWRFP